MTTPGIFEMNIPGRSVSGSGFESGSGFGSGSGSGSYMDPTWILICGCYMDPYVGPIWIPARILYRSLHESYMDPYMDPIWIPMWILYGSL